MEIWKDIEEYKGKYQISNMGRVKSFVGKNPHKKTKILKPCLATNGYIFYNLSQKGNSKSFSVHRLVAKLFLVKPNNKPQINHKNGIKTDNRVENLEWVTCKENVNHSIKVLGKNRTGENNGRAKLNANQVSIIKELLEYSNLKQREIADYFSVSRYTVTDINRGKNWSHIKTEPPITVGFC